MRNEHNSDNKRRSRQHAQQDQQDSHRQPGKQAQPGRPDHDPGGREHREKEKERKFGGDNPDDEQSDRELL